MKKFKLIIQIMLAFFLAQLLFNFAYEPNRSTLRGFFGEETASSLAAESADRSAAAADALEKYLPQALLAKSEKSENSGAPVTGELRVTVLDVGHGDAILLQYRGKNYLVDVGDDRESQKLYKALAQLGITKIDSVFVTHHHRDHMGSILKVLPRYNVRRVYDNGGVNPAEKMRTSRQLRQLLDNGGYGYRQGGALAAGARLELAPGLTLDVLAPGDFWHPYIHGKTEALTKLNNTSLVMQLRFGAFTMLLMGDAEAPVEEGLLHRYGAQLKSDVLKVGHHGSSTSSIYKFLERVKPRYALISCAEYEKFHHPNANVVGRLEHLGAKVLTTAAAGSLTVVTDGVNYSVTSAR